MDEQRSYDDKRISEMGKAKHDEKPSETDCPKGGCHEFIVIRWDYVYNSAKVVAIAGGKNNVPTHAPVMKIASVLACAKCLKVSALNFKTT